MYLSLLGKQGLKHVAHLCLDKAAYARERLGRIPGVAVMGSSPTFNELTLHLPISRVETDPEALVAAPRSTPVCRPDEVKAAKDMDFCYT